MALSEKREEAERLYVKRLMPCPAIAEQLKVDQGTVYRWKSEAAQKGGALDWDAKRRAYQVSPDELKTIFAESLKEAILKVRDNPDLLMDSKKADALAKNVKVLQSIDIRGNYLGVAIDLVEVINVWLAEHEPELKGKMEPHWDQIYEALKEYSTRKGIF
jgi:transposase